MLTLPQIHVHMEICKNLTRFLVDAGFLKTHVSACVLKNFNEKEYTLPTAPGGSRGQLGVAYPESRSRQIAGTFRKFINCKNPREDNGRSLAMNIMICEIPSIKAETKENVLR